MNDNQEMREMIEENRQLLTDLLVLHEKREIHWQGLRPLLDANGVHFETLTNQIDDLRTENKIILRILKNAFGLLAWNSEDNDVNPT